MAGALAFIFGLWFLIQFLREIEMEKVWFGLRSDAWIFHKNVSLKSIDIRNMYELEMLKMKMTE